MNGGKTALYQRSTISKEKAREYKRKIFKTIEKTFFNYRQILILNGLRRIGKTTIIFQLIEKLLKKKIKPKNIIYFSFDEMIEEPIKILEEYTKITKIDWRREKIFVFFDEIQKLKNWSSKINLVLQQANHHIGGHIHHCILALHKQPITLILLYPKKCFPKLRSNLGKHFFGIINYSTTSC